MGDTLKPYFVKRTKDRGITDDDDFRRGHPQQDYLIMDDYAKGHSNKMEKGLPKKKIAPGNYGNTPRKGPYAVSSNPYAFKNPMYSQPAWMNDNHKDQNKRWLPDELAGNADSWRELKPGPRIPAINRSRKDSFQESDECYRWADGRGCRAARRLFQKDIAGLEAMSEMEAGSPGTLHVSRLRVCILFFIQISFDIFSNELFNVIMLGFIVLYLCDFNIFQTLDHHKLKAWLGRRVGYCPPKLKTKKVY